LIFIKIKDKNSAQLELMFGSVELSLDFFFFYLLLLLLFFFIFFMRLYTEKPLSSLPEIASKVCEVGGWWWWLWVNLVIAFGEALA
jgi:hypothetical protein